MLQITQKFLWVQLNSRDSNRETAKQKRFEGLSASQSPKAGHTRAGRSDILETQWRDLPESEIRVIRANRPDAL